MTLASNNQISLERIEKIGPYGDTKGEQFVGAATLSNGNKKIAGFIFGVSKNMELKGVFGSTNSNENNGFLMALGLLVG